MIDSHCHLDREPIISNIDDVIKRSRAVGISKLLTICTNDSNYNQILNLTEQHKIIYGTYGIHPHEVDSFIATTQHIIKKINSNPKIIGVGESGLDFYYSNSKKKSQIESFDNHIRAAIELNIPIIVHSRNAEKETLNCLLKYKSKRIKILMHCFTGSFEFAMNLLDMNVFFSASGIITFNNSSDLQSTFSKLPLDRLLIETDSPFLAPEPYRGKKNEPSYLVNTLKKLSELHFLSSKEMDFITTNNFNILFNNS